MGCKNCGRDNGGRGTLVHGYCSYGCKEESELRRKELQRIDREKWAGPQTHSTEGSGSGDGGCATVFAWIFGITLAVMVFHAPFGYFVWKRLGISPGEATYASVRCAEGWIGSALIWGSLASLIYGIMELCRKNGAKTFYGAVILAGFSTWFVWSNMEPIRDSHNAIKAEELAEAAKKAANEGDSTQPQTKHSEPITPSNTSTLSNSLPTTTFNPPSPNTIHLPHTEPQPIVPSVSSYNQKENRNSGLPRPSITTNITTPQSKHSDQPLDLIEIESSDGRHIRAQILALLTTTVLVRREDGQKFEIPLSSLTELSKQKIHDWREVKRHSKNNP